MKTIAIGKEYRAKGFKTNEGAALVVKVEGIQGQASDGVIYNVAAVNDESSEITTLHECYLSQIKKAVLASDPTITQINRRGKANRRWK